MARQTRRSRIVAILAGAIHLLWIPAVQADVDRQIIRDVQERNVQALKKVLAEGFNPNATDEFGRTVLHIAAGGGDEETVKALIAGGASVNMADKMGMSALHFAVRAARPKAVKVLLQAGADPNARDKDGCTPLHRMAGKKIRGRREPSWETLSVTIQRLVDAGANLNGKDRHGRTALEVAQQTGNGAAETLLKRYDQNTQPPQQGREQIRVPTEQYRALATKAVNVFGLGLYARLVRDDKNLVISPLGVFSPLSMGAEGAEGLTRDEMLQVLAITKARVPLAATLGSLLRELPQTVRQKGGELGLANGIWIRKSSRYRTRRQFEQLLRSHYGASIHEADANKPADQIAAEINTWVKERTHNRITDLVSPGKLAKQPWVLSVISAVYFKGDWAIPFEAKMTKHDTFTRLDGSQIKVPLMHNSSRNFPYMEGADFQALEMPYRGWGLSMVVFLPKKTDGLPGLEISLRVQSLSQWIDQLAKWPAGVNVSFPRFTARSHQDLNAPLQLMGMKRAFQPQADFSGMIEGLPTAGKHAPLFISGVHHEACIEVTEKGTEAAAGTAVHWKKSTKTIEPKDFRADHPFMFIIYDKLSGCILFMGRVTDPSKMN
jgi:serpin B